MFKQIIENNSKKKIVKYLFLNSILIIFLCTLWGAKANAKVYRLTETDGVLTGTAYNIEVMADMYVNVKKMDGYYKVVRPTNMTGTLYYFDQDGIGTPYKGTGFISIYHKGIPQVYYCKKGAVVKNQIVGNEKQGYYYVDSTGIRVTDKTTKLAVKFVRSHTKDSDPKNVKLKKCYNYLSYHYTYKRTYENLYPKAKDMKSFAYDMLSSKQGNCHRYAASFAYIAQVLGYESRVVVGQTTSSHGGMTPHGWNEIKQNGKWYVCDPDLQRQVNSYMRVNTPYHTTVTRRCTISAKDGKVSWK